MERIAIVALATTMVLGAAAGQTAAPQAAEGAAIDASRFRHIRPIPGGDAGLMALPLDAAVLAESAGPARGFADVRVIDPSDHEVPYLLEPRGERFALELTLERATSAAAERTLGADQRTGSRRGPFSVYRLRLPYASLPQAQLVLSSDAAGVFDRFVVAGVERAADRHIREPWLEELAAGRWVHTDPGGPGPELTLSIRSVDVSTILIVVDEGDNRPLPLGPARILLPSFRIRFYRNAGTPLRLAYGREDLAPPRYDLALLAAQVLRGNATDVAAGADEPKASTPPEALLTSPWFFWAVLCLAVVVLLGFVVRLVARA